MIGTSPLWPPDVIQTSLSEFEALLKQAFEGCGLDPSMSNDAAKGIVWSASRGFEVEPSISPEALDALANENKPAYRVLKRSQDELQLDFQGNNTLYLVWAPSDWLVSRAVSGTAVAEIRNAVDPIALAKAVTDLARHGLESVAYWVDEKSNTAYRLRCSATQSEAHYECYQWLETNKEPQDAALWLACGINTHEINALSDRFFANRSYKLESVVTPEAFELRQQQSLETGLHIAPQIWGRLEYYRDLTLVTASRQSRLGAGA